MAQVRTKKSSLFKGNWKWERVKTIEPIVEPLLRKE